MVYCGRDSIPAAKNGAAALPIRKCRPRAGIAMVEFAIAIPVLILIFMLFWDAMMVALVEVRHWSGMIQVTLNLDTTPLRLQRQFNASGLVGISTRRLSPIPDPAAGIVIDELRHPEQGFLTRIHRLFNGALDRAGTGAAYVKHDMMLELWYITACTDAVGVCATRPLGAYAGAQVAGDYGATPTPITNFRGPTTAASPCFPAPSAGSASAEAQFQAYVQKQLGVFASSIVPPANPMNPPPTYLRPVATKVLEVSTNDPTIGLVKEYVDYRPVVFMMSCSIPPRFFSRDEPVYTFHTFFPDREVSVS